MKTKFCLMTFEDYIGMKKRIKHLEEEIKDIKSADKRSYQLSSRDKHIKQLEEQKAFLISCIKCGEQLEDDWEKTLEG